MVPWNEDHACRSAPDHVELRVQGALCLLAAGEEVEKDRVDDLLCNVGRLVGRFLHRLRHAALVGVVAKEHDGRALRHLPHSLRQQLQRWLAGAVGVAGITDQQQSVIDLGAVDRRDLTHLVLAVVWRQVRAAAESRAGEDVEG